MASGNAYWRSTPDGFEVFEIQSVDMIYTNEEVRRMGYPFVSQISRITQADIAAALADHDRLQSFFGAHLYGRAVESLTPEETAEIVYLVHVTGSPEDGPRGWAKDLPLADLGIPPEDGARAENAFRIYARITSLRLALR
jgi:hypothetical protein